MNRGRISCLPYWYGQTYENFCFEGGVECEATEKPQSSKDAPKSHIQNWDIPKTATVQTLNTLELMRSFNWIYMYLVSNLNLNLKELLEFTGLEVGGQKR